jgi:hypothetical protein
MKEELRSRLEKELKKHESLPGFLEAMSRRGSDDLREARAAAEQGPHPSSETLYSFVLGWGAPDQDDLILDHIFLCG